MQINVIHHINKLKDKKHMIIPIDAEKAFNKIHHLFMIKTLQKMGIEGTYLNIAKAIYDKVYGKHYSQWWKTENILPKIRKKTRVSTFTTVIQHSSGSLSYSNQKEKETKGIQIRKEEVKCSLFAGDMTVHRKPEIWYQKIARANQWI